LTHPDVMVARDLMRGVVGRRLRRLADMSSMTTASPSGQSASTTWTAR
jgi:hypothetical protein